MLDLEILKTELLNKSASIWDVREKDEWQVGHIIMASHCPLKCILNGQLNQYLPEEVLVNKEAKIYLYCRSGIRSTIAQVLLTALGFINVVNLKYGFEDLKNLGLPAT